MNIPLIERKNSDLGKSYLQNSFYSLDHDSKGQYDPFKNPPDLEMAYKHAKARRVGIPSLE
jgi:hypothetical protein